MSKIHTSGYRMYLFYMISKTKYLVLQILLAIKNNNVKKIPNYDPEHQLHLQKILRNFLRAGAAVTPMKIGYDELIRAGQVSKLGSVKM